MHFWTSCKKSDIKAQLYCIVLTKYCIIAKRVGLTRRAALSSDQVLLMFRFYAQSKIKQNYKTLEYHPFNSSNGQQTAYFAAAETRDPRLPTQTMPTYSVYVGETELTGDVGADGPIIINSTHGRLWCQRTLCFHALVTKVLSFGFILSNSVCNNQDKVTGICQLGIVITDRMYPRMFSIQLNFIVCRRSL